jgi:hypothetical protein
MRNKMRCKTAPHPVDDQEGDQASLSLLSTQ